MDLRIPGFGGIKDRLSSRDTRAERSSRSGAFAPDEYDDFLQEDFGEYGFDDDADYAQVSSQIAAAELPSSSMPKLVTADDVRSHTQYTPPESSKTTRAARETSARNTDARASSLTSSIAAPSAARAASTSASDTSALSAGSHSASATQSASRSSGGAASVTSRVAGAAASGRSNTSSTSATSAASSGSVVSARTRIVTVITPTSYADAERLAKALKAGDAAVLSLRTTPEDLGKRILDFSFGVACAFDAQVECVSRQVFAITRGAALSESELGRLRDQGLM